MFGNQLRNMCTVFAILMSAAFPNLANCQIEGAAGAITFGAALDHLASKVGNLIDKAANAGEVIEIGAGGQIATAIACAKTAYADSLELTIDQLNKSKKMALDDLTTQVAYLENHTLDELKKIANQGCLIVNSLPLSNTFPQVAWYTPTYTAPDANEIDLQIQGNFFDTPRSGYDPTLTVGGETYSPSQKGTLRLGFKIPSSKLSPEDKKLKTLKAHLTVPYRESMAFFLHRRREAEFDFQFSLLPKSAGKITFDTDHTEVRRQTQENHSGEFKQESSNDDIPDPIGSGRVSASPPTAGWFVEPASVHIKVNWAEGDWTDFGNRSNLANAAWSVGTRHHGLGTSGKVHFQLLWTEYRDAPVHVPGKQESELTWGSSRAFTIPTGGSWKAKYVRFDGKEFDITSAAFSNPYIQVQTSGDSVSIVTIP